MIAILAANQNSLRNKRITCGGGVHQAHQTKRTYHLQLTMVHVRRKKPIWIDPLVVGPAHKRNALTIKEESGRAHLWVGPVHQSRLMVRVRRRKKYRSTQ